MDNKKSGIRLRHLEQQPDQGGRRDLSPNNPNRKKIFEKNQRVKQNERTPPPEEKNKYVRNQQEDSFNEYQQLVDNLKKKTMEVELRDETIKYLNKQIEELKAHIKHKDREILKLNQEISLLQKEKEAWKTAPKENVFDSFKNPSQVTPYSYEPTPITSHHHSIEVVQPRPSFQLTNARQKPAYQERALQEEISLGNLNGYKNTKQEKMPEEEILSPFMALNNNRSFSQSTNNPPKKEAKTSRTANQNIPAPTTQHSSTDTWAFNKKKSNNDFDVSREDYMARKTVLQTVDKQLQKFNIFGEPPESKKDIFARSKLQIEDSRQFRFEQFDDKGYGDFASKAIY